MLLQGNNLTKTFAEKNVFKDVTLSLANGKLYILEGPSGCGKSTLMTLLGLLDKPDSGNIFLDKQEITYSKYQKIEEIRRSYYSFLSQDDNLIDYLTLRENLSLVSKDQKRIEKYCQRLEIDKLLDKKTSEMSRGEKARGSIIRVILEDRPIMFLDEPTGHLDSRRTNLVYKWLEEICANHIILVISHDFRQKCPTLSDNSKVSFISICNGMKCSNKETCKCILPKKVEARPTFAILLKMGLFSQCKNWLKTIAFALAFLIIPFFFLTYVCFSQFSIPTESTILNLNWIIDKKYLFIITSVFCGLLLISLDALFIFENQKEKKKEYTLLTLEGYSSVEIIKEKGIDYFLFTIPIDTVSMLLFYCLKGNWNMIISNIYGLDEVISIICFYPWHLFLFFSVFLLIPLVLLIISSLRKPLNLADQMKKDDE